ncbi:MAG: succinyldiaminopimelate transaminase [Betaproteobacteria bacterium]|nr:succinyldiaminopimelate transaminase [Betaproteobacteria bacterium]HMV19700.1 succinyldiaminopimelate transaminase [Rhodocyclaceae bacterium]HNM21678.1 succinyldiaminopimelate transaminase [Rhodocyclaceae bacterium]HNM79553.1 succinyldiaminopimelate transaminase [Rhodocyclaceae bacterium]HNP04536.1 succinyldiaminopimelate transaminase [Rhodocyclaceae bacterium]
MNPHLARLHPYPFEKLRQLFAGVAPHPDYREIKLSIGEPQHPTPAFILESLTAGLKGLANYPTTQGIPALRQAIAGWCARRYGLELDPETEILPVNGSREALFSFAQTVIDAGRGTVPLVVSPNPFYQIYEGAAYLAGAEPRFLNTLPESDYAFDLDALTPEEWARVQLFYVCSPANPTGKVLDLAGWKKLFDLADRYGFVIASDECYSEIFFDEDNPPLGGLQAAKLLGRGSERLVMFSSLSKRSNVPGMRSGFVAGDAAILKKFLLYRTYHGCALPPPVQAASVAAWNDEAHVLENRRQYREKFAAVTPGVAEVLGTAMPDAGFYLWAHTPGPDTDFARGLFAAYNVIVLPGSFLAREAWGVNPGAGFVRIALVASLDECLEAARRIRQFAQQR